MAKEHPHLTVSDCGLVVDKELPYLAASPDGLVRCPDCTPPLGLVEVKCPYKWRETSVSHACTDPTFCCEEKDGQIVLKRKHVYYFQIQGQLGVTKRKWCDFVIWTMKDLHIERIEADEELWMRMREKLKLFYLRCVVPEIFSSRIMCKKVL